MKLLFGDIVVVDENQIGVVVKSWVGSGVRSYDVYVRTYNRIRTYDESDVERYMVRHKYLDEDELEWQENAKAYEQNVI